MMGYPERLAEAESESEARSILDELLYESSPRWKQSHVEQYLSERFHAILREYFNSDGRLRRKSASLKVVRWLERKLGGIGGIGFIPLLKCATSFAGSLASFRNAVDYAIDCEGENALSMVDENLVVFTAMVEVETATTSVRAARELVSFANVGLEAKVLGSLEKLAPWLDTVEPEKRSEAAHHLVCLTDYLADVSFRVIYRAQNAVSPSQIANWLDGRSQLQWPEELVQYHLMEDWRFWPQGSNGFKLASDMREGARTSDDIARRFLAALDGTLEDHSFLSRNPFAVETGFPSYSRLRVYVVKVSQGRGKTGRYVAHIDAGSKGPRGKIQVDRSGGRIPVLCGYCYEEDVYVLWDMGLYDEYSYGHTVSVGMDAVYAAVAGELGCEHRSIRAGKEIVVTTSPERLAEGLSERIELSRQRLSGGSYDV